VINVRYVKCVIAIAALAVVTAAATPALAAKIDGKIEAAAQHSYVFKTYLKDDEITVKSKNGAVTLTGTVTENFHKSLAHETVAGLPGVKSIDNRLETKSSPPLANSDAWLRDKVRVTLSFHRSVSAATTDVTVKDGIVNLRGVANSEAQRELTAEYARDVEGVKDITNDMTVSDRAGKKRSVGEKIDDSSITAQVKMALLYHRTTSVLSTTVTTRHGVVTLEGKARTEAEKELVTTLAADIKGVTRVSNKMVTD
jgi:osmotically-inducible protein OsmY